MLKPFYLLKGSDETFVEQQLTTLLKDIGQNKKAFIEEFNFSESKDFVQFLDNLTTPSLFQDYKVAILRHPELLTAQQCQLLISQIQTLQDCSVVVLFVSKSPNKDLLALAYKYQSFIEAEIGGQKQRDQWVRKYLKEKGIRLSQDATELLEQHLGEDLAMLASLTDILIARFGENPHLSTDDIYPYLVQAGEIAPWELTQAIEAGNTTGALQALNRLIHSSDKHPVQILSYLSNHYQLLFKAHRIPSLDAEFVRKVLGLKHSFQARQIMENAQRLTFNDISRMSYLLFQADLDLKGKSGLSAELTLEILVARLCQIFRVAPAKKPKKSAVR